MSKRLSMYAVYFRYMDVLNAHSGSYFYYFGGFR